jgi:hypothetical protein
MCCLTVPIRCTSYLSLRFRALGRFELHLTNIGDVNKVPYVSEFHNSHAMDVYLKKGFPISCLFVHLIPVPLTLKHVIEIDLF